MSTAEPFGLLNLLKPPGMTAHDVVATVRKRIKLKQVGHAGTLDPLATGVLPVAVGRATRLLPYLQSGKEYLAEIQFGVATDTADAQGNVIAELDADFDEAALEAILPRFRGDLQQRPPMVSAVHYQGKRLYELARQGIVIEDVPLRNVTISALELRRFYSGPRPRALVRVACTAGTYVRSLAVDLGAALGVPASLAFLLRSRAGDFAIEESRTLAEEPMFVSPETYLGHLVRRDASEAELVAIGHGKRLESHQEPTGALVRVHGPERLMAIYECQGETLAPRAVFA